MRGSAGGFVGVSGCDYAPYSHGANIFLTEDRVCARSISWELKGAVITYKIISTFFSKILFTRFDHNLAYLP